MAVELQATLQVERLPHMAAWKHRLLASTQHRHLASIQHLDSTRHLLHMRRLAGSRKLPHRTQQRHLLRMMGRDMINCERELGMEGKEREGQKRMASKHVPLLALERA